MGRSQVGCSILVCCSTCCAQMYVAVAVWCAAGRLASSNPNMQAVPAHDDRGKMFRAAFTADEGHLLVSADYSQVRAPPVRWTGVTVLTGRTAHTWGSGRQ